LRTCGADSPGKLPGYLEDYAYFAEALTHVYEATFEERWLRAAESMADVILTRFADREHGGFFSTADDHEDLIVRPKDLHDGSTPSGNAMAVTALVRLATFVGRDDFRAAADRTLAAFHGVMEEHPSAAGQMLIALDFHLGPVQEVALVGELGSAAFQHVLTAARAPFAPRRITACGVSPSPTLPLLANRTSTGPVTLYVCENATCQAPIADSAEAERLLRAV
jgi:uncharacterized protein YyaL (SSP411 family)